MRPLDHTAIDSTAASIECMVYTDEVGDATTDPALE